jgi:hypothetical protein
LRMVMVLKMGDARTPPALLSPAERLGYWASVLTTLLAVSFIGIGLFGSSYTEAIKYPYVLTTIRPLDYAVWYPAVLLAMAFVTLVACIHRVMPDGKRVFTLVALSFAVIYAGVTAADFFVQWTVVLPSIANNETVGLSWFSIYNPHGFPIALESLGYLMLDVSLLFLAAVFDGKGRVELATRWFFVAGFALTVSSFIALSLAGAAIVVFEVVAVTTNAGVLIASGLLLRVFFKRAGARATSAATA